jgi:purine-nucleoside phosphorylase
VSAAVGGSTLSARVAVAADVVRRRFSRTPDAAIVLGTGLGALAREIEVEASVEYGEIPGFSPSTVESHAGRLLCGTLAGRAVVAMQGRLHAYEGYALADVAFPVRVMRALGAPVLVLSNACGGMNPLWEPGDLMLIADHLNFIGGNPLVGPNDDAAGARFPDMTRAYDADLAQLARDAALESGVVLREGVYAAVAGPSLETRAEYRMLRALGADVVGMSTVPEVIAAAHCGMRVLGLSIITDRCLPDALEPATLEQIVGVAARAEPSLTRVVRGVLERL